MVDVDCQQGGICVSRRGIFAALLCAALLLSQACAALAADAGEYRIEVDLANQITTVYHTSDGSVARQMICSTGANNTTPRGTFRLQASRASDRQPWYFIGKYQCFVKYPTRIQGAILFHSLPYADRDMTTVDLEALSQLGSTASHGCVRLRWEDARWIAENCPDGTVTRIYGGEGDREELRALLLTESYSDENGASYEAFLSPTPKVAANALALGEVDERVEALQRRLSRLGYYGDAPTGEFDRATLIAVMRFQRASGTEPTGIVTPALEQRILAGH